MKIMLTAALALLLPAISHASPWAGKLDLNSAPAIGAWQSVTSADEAVGLSKHLWSLNKGDQAVLNLGVFGGVSKPMLAGLPDLSVAPTFLAGVTAQVPGSALDWALGTKMGDAWLPKLKTGILLADDLTRPRQLHLRPTFVGVGLAYPLGS